MATDPSKANFLVEWYHLEPAAASPQDAASRLSRAGAAAGTPGQPAAVLTVLVAVPGDQTLFAVFTATDVDDVIRLCEKAGWPADRISTDVGAWVQG